MGCRRSFRLHGGRCWRRGHKSEGELPGKCRSGILRARRKGSVESAESRGCGPCRESHCNARPAKLFERDPSSPVKKAIGQPGRPKSIPSPLDISRYNDYSVFMNTRSPFSRRPLSLENRIFVALLQAADTLAQEAEQLLKAAGLTGAQYNVLRILRGAEPQGLACRAIGDRMISHDPDMTRLLHRLENPGLLTRPRHPDTPPLRK